MTWMGFCVEIRTITTSLFWQRFDNTKCIEYMYLTQWIPIASLPHPVSNLSHSHSTEEWELQKVGYNTVFNYCSMGERERDGERKKRRWIEGENERERMNAQHLLLFICLKCHPDECQLFSTKEKQYYIFTTIRRCKGLCCLLELSVKLYCLTHYYINSLSVTFFVDAPLVILAKSVVQSSC